MCKERTPEPMSTHIPLGFHISEIDNDSSTGNNPSHFTNLTQLFLSQTFGKTAKKKFSGVNVHLFLSSIETGD